MKCDQFEQRMQDLLDLRQDVGKDALLKAHAETCSSCRDQMRIWLQIDLTLGRAETGSKPIVVSVPASNPRPGIFRKHHRALLAFAATAAAVVLMWTPDRLTTPVASVGESINAPAATQSLPADRPFQVDRGRPLTPGAIATAGQTPVMTTPDSTVHIDLLAGPWQPDQWWNQVTDDRWIAFSGVDSVREGVAPIGRSVRRAIGILMTRVILVPGPSRQPSAELPVDGIKEQTSDCNRESAMIGWA